MAMGIPQRVYVRTYAYGLMSESLAPTPPRLGCASEARLRLRLRQLTASGGLHVEHVKCLINIGSCKYQYLGEKTQISTLPQRV
eukprot:scaffold15934_cov52-Cyclotella_meneghiniana.AAC.17